MFIDNSNTKTKRMHNHSQKHETVAYCRPDIARFYRLLPALQLTSHSETFKAEKEAILCKIKKNTN